MKRSARGPSAEVIRKNLLSPTIKRAALTDIVLGNQSPWTCNNRAHSRLDKKPPYFTPSLIMSSKYAFTKSLKEVRFLFCQTSEHSAATRFGASLVPPLLPFPLRILTEVNLFGLTEFDPSLRVYPYKINRSFLMRAYPTMKKNNPHTPIMLREAQGTEPRVFARYGMFCSIRGEEEN